MKPHESLREIEVSKAKALNFALWQMLKGRITPDQADSAMREIHEQYKPLLNEAAGERDQDSSLLRYMTPQEKVDYHHLRQVFDDLAMARDLIDRFRQMLLGIARQRRDEVR